MTKSKLIWPEKYLQHLLLSINVGRCDSPIYRLSATNFAFWKANTMRKLKYPIALYNTYESRKRRNIFTKNIFFAARQWRQSDGGRLRKTE